MMVLGGLGGEKKGNVGGGKRKEKRSRSREKYGVVREMRGNKRRIGICGRWEEGKQ